MNKELRWKFILVGILVLVFCLAIYNNGLKPGIDLAGGSSLLYEIDTTDMPESEKRAISEDMIRILRQRIDPSDQMGLIWRPHGVDKVEIQLPLATEETRRLREEYKQALSGLESGNINMVKVKEALVHPAGKTRDEYVAARTAQIEALSAGNESRKAILDELCVITDKVEEAKAALAPILEKVNDLAAKAEEGGIFPGRLDSLSYRWNELDEPNRATEISGLAKEDPVLEEVVREYMSARAKRSSLRNDLNAEGGLIAQQEGIIRKLEQSNINLDRFEKYLAAAPQRRAEEIKALIDAHPSQEVTIKEIVAAYDKYAGVSGRLDDPEDLKRKLKGSGVLEFRILPSATDEALAGRVSDYITKLAEFGPVKASSEDYVWRKIRDIKTFRQSGVIMGTYVEDTYVLASNKKEEILVGSGEKTWKLKSARPDQDQYGSPAVSFAFNTPGSELFYNLTKANIDKPLCILLDGEAISAPNIQSAIRGSGIINGSFSFKETIELSDKLKAGSLPAALSKEPIAENNIGPTLGKDNLQAGMRSAMWGMIAVVIFMLIYYRFAGTLADLALLMNVLFIVGSLAFMRSTFTLPGIAGLILTVGMAVDANVLIFERVREELKSGSSLRIAIKNGYDRAFWTIFDSNLTTFLIALILWVLASEEIKGFALVLMVGIVSSMFTALFITRLVFDWLIDLGKLGNNLNMMHWLANVNLNWMSFKPVFWVLSGIAVIASWSMFMSRQGDSNSMYSIEFTGGTSIQVRLEADKANGLLSEQQQSLSQEEKGLLLRGIIEERVQKAAKDPEIAASRVQQVGPVENLEYEIATPATNLVTVRITPGEGEGGSLAEIEAKFDAVAQDMGDDRLANNEFSEESGVITMVTHQT
ncbi:MAG: protein translocase subunit SecD, partial [Sedimentisphaerales bacterium]|nr:protein translocase subunit SecD [Sedimentisphaerales bacterium]